MVDLATIAGGSGDCIAKRLFSRGRLKQNHLWELLAYDKGLWGGTYVQVLRDGQDITTWNHPQWVDREIEKLKMEVKEKP